MAIKRNETTGRIIAKRFTIRQLEKADENSDGYCLACGKKHHGIESDARKYTCESCKNPLVYGAGEIALMGLVK